MAKKIEKIIKEKLIEHIQETELVQQAIDETRKNLKDNKDLSQAQKLVILKDKMMFHKACAMVLQEILDDSDKENS